MRSIFLVLRKTLIGWISKSDPLPSMANNSIIVIQSSNERKNMETIVSANLSENQVSVMTDLVEHNLEMEIEFINEDELTRKRIMTNIGILFALGQSKFAEQWLVAVSEATVI